MVIQPFHVETGGHVEIAIIGHGVSKHRSIFERGPAHPTIGSVVGRIGIYPVEQGDQIEI